MKTALISLLVLVTPLAAQHRGGGGGVSHGGGHAGSVGMHSGFTGARPGFSGTRSGFSGVRGANRGIFPGRGYYPRYRFYGGYLGWPLFDPFWFDPYGYDSYGYNSPPYGAAYGPASYSGGYDSPPESAPPVIINQQFQPQPVNPVVLEPPAAPPSPPPGADGPDASEYRPPVYLLAFKDGVIRAAVAYWVSGESLHYVTRELETRVVPLSQLDRDFSLRLNRERQVEFRLPHAN